MKILIEQLEKDNFIIFDQDSNSTAFNIIQIFKDEWFTFYCTETEMYFESLEEVFDWYQKYLGAKE